MVHAGANVIVSVVDDFVRAHPTSPSQIDTYRDCNRKWGFRNLDKVQRPSNKYAQRGTDVHEVLEAWLRDGTSPPKTDAGKIALPGLKYLPLPKTVTVEGEFLFESAQAVYRGKKDWRSRTPRVIKIGDHKTTTDLKWVKTAQVLKTDVQANVYAVHELFGLHKEDQPIVEQSWVWYRADPKRPKVLKVVLNVVPDERVLLPVPEDVQPEHFGMMTYAQLGEQWVKIEQDAVEMLDHHRQGRKALDLEYDVATCPKYGGCPYRGDPCRLKMSELIRGHMSQITIAEKMRAAVQEQKRAAAVAATSTTTQTTTTTSAPASTQGALPPGKTIKLAAHRPASQDASPEGKELAATPTGMLTAAEAQSRLPDVNPPDLSKKAEAAPTSTASIRVPEREQVPEQERAQKFMITTAALVTQGVIAARIFRDSDSGYADDVAALSVKITRALQKATTA